MIDGRGWRSGALVEQRELTQWAFKITRLYRGSARGAEDAGEVAREGSPDAGELDRPLRRPAAALGAGPGDRARRPCRARDLHDAARHAVRRLVHGHRARSSAGQGGGRKDPKLAAFCDECRRMGTSVADIEKAEKMGFDTGIKAVHPFDPNWQVPVYVANFILMDYGTGAIFGCPGQRPARHRVRQEVRPADHSRRGCRRTSRARQGAGQDARRRCLSRRRRDDQLALPGRPDAQGRLRRGRQAARKRKARRQAGRRAQSQFPPARLGPVAPALLGLPDPGHPLRGVRHRAGARPRTCP